MKIIGKLIKYITRKDIRFIINSNYGIYKHIDDEAFLRRAFKIHMGYFLDLVNPATFNEKLQWLKLYDRKQIYTRLVDKYEVKKVVAQRIGEQYIIPCFGVWENFDEIPFDQLPDQFVLKCTHDSGGVVIVKDKKTFDKKSARKKINKRMKRNYFWMGREWPYKDVKPRILAEKYMEDMNTQELRDYKFFCFDGITKCFKVDFDRFVSHHANYYNMKGKLMEIGEQICPPDTNRNIIIPPELEKMKILAETLSAEIPFVRVDFYDVDGHIYFGEFTFYPASGFGKFVKSENDELLGSWIQLPTNKQEEKIKV